MKNILENNHVGNFFNSFISGEQTGNLSTDLRNEENKSNKMIFKFFPCKWTNLFIESTGFIFLRYINSKVYHQIII